MAKQPINALERHVEKAVLGICGSALLASIALYLVASPNKIELGSEFVGPDSIDQHILDSSRQLRDRLRSARVEVVEIPDPLPDLEAALAPLAYSGLGPELPSPVPFLPRVPSSIDAQPIAGEIKLAEVIAPDKPITTAGRATLDLVPPVALDDLGPQDTGRFPPQGARSPFETDVNWVTVGALFHQQRQISVCKSAGYKATRRNPYVVGVELQRRERLAGGSDTDWSRWTDVKQYTPTELGDLPVVEIAQGAKGAVATESTRQRVKKFFRLLKNHQADLHRPMFPRVVYGDGWIYPKSEGVEVPVLDDELCTPTDKQLCEPRAYPHQWDIAPPVDTAEQSPEDIIDEKLDEARRLLDEDEPNWRLARQLAEEVLAMPEGKDNPDVADQIVKDANQAKRDEVRRKGSGSTGSVTEEDEEPEKRRRSQHQVVWAHDAAEPDLGGAESGRTYQYRMRLNLYNRFCAVPTDLADAKQAETVVVTGAWSEPSDPVHIASSAEFFFTRGNPFSGSGAKAAIFKWFEGVWVTHAFPLKVGHSIGGSAREQVGVLDSGAPDKPNIDFDTGAMVVDVDYDYSYRPRKRKGKGGFAIGSPQRTIAMIYVDGSGVLRQRVLGMDKASAEYKAYKEIVFDPAKMTQR